MRRIVLVALVMLACGPPPFPPYDSSVMGVCNNAYLPAALGNHWDYDVTDPAGKPLGTAAVEVIAVDAAGGRFTIRSLYTEGRAVHPPRTQTLSCAGGALVPASAATPANAAPRRTQAAQPLVSLPQPAQVEQAGFHWSAKSGQAFMSDGKRQRVDVQLDETTQPRRSVSAPAGTYLTSVIAHHAVITPSLGDPTVIDATTFVAPNVGMVRAEWPDRVVALRKFTARGGVTLDDVGVQRRGLTPRGAPPAPARASRLRNQAGMDCYCDSCPIDVWGNPEEPCELCDPCQCRQTCGCDGQPECQPPPPPPPPPGPCPMSGGLMGDLCPEETKFKAIMAAQELCRLGYWNSLLGGLFSLFGGPDANDACGLHGMPQEWEPITDGDAVGVVTAGYDSRQLCDATKGIISCATSPSGPCETPNTSPHDNCFTHQDKDFEFDIALPDTPAAMAILGYANGNSGGESYGRDIGVEWERMYMMPPLSNSGGIPWTLTPRVSGGGVTLGVPWPGDTVAIHGPVIADCGHPNQRGDNHARTEFHPPTAIAWIHKEGAGHYTLWLRASSHATFPRYQPKNFLAKLHVASLTLPDGATGAVVAQPPQCDFLATNYNRVKDSSCQYAVGDAPFVCAPPFDLPDFTGPNDSVPCRQTVEAHMELGADQCGVAGQYFNFRVASAEGGVKVDLDVNDSASEDNPYLYGAHVSLCVPDCAGLRCGDPSRNGCGVCGCPGGQTCEPQSHKCCDLGAACAGQACGAAVCDGELRCANGGCATGMTCRANQCVDANGCPAGQPLCTCRGQRRCLPPDQCTQLCACSPQCAPDAACGDDDSCGDGPGSCPGNCDLDGSVCIKTANKYHCKVIRKPGGGQVP